MAKKKKEESAPGAPPWMATFADMVTLLLAFFVMLLSFSSIQESKFHEAVASLQGAFGVLQSPPTVVSQDEVIMPKAHEAELEEIVYEVQRMREALLEEELQDTVTLSVEKDGIAIRISTPFLFHPAKADLKPESFPVLDKLASVLGKLGNKIRVEGHTDNIPINNEEFPSNWELSTSRAISVLKRLGQGGVQGERLSAVGYGEWQPVASNDDEAGRRQNRRVEIFVEYKDLPENSLREAGMAQPAEVQGG